MEILRCRTTDGTRDRTYLGTSSFDSLEQSLIMAYPNLSTPSKLADDFIDARTPQDLADWSTHSGTRLLFSTLCTSLPVKIDLPRILCDLLSDARLS